MADYNETISLKYVVSADDVKKSVEDATRQANQRSKQASQAGASGSTSGSGESNNEQRRQADAREREGRRARTAEERSAKAAASAERNAEAARKRTEREAEKERKRKEREDKEPGLQSHPAYRAGSILQTIGRLTGMPSLYRVGQMAHTAARFSHGAGRFGEIGAKAGQFFRGGGASRVVGGTATAPGGGLPVAQAASSVEGAEALGGAATATEGAAGGAAAALGGVAAALGPIALVAAAVGIALLAFKKAMDHLGEATSGAAKATLHGDPSQMAHAGVHAAQAASYAAGPVIGLVLDPLIGQFHKLIDVMDETVGRLAQYSGAASAAEAQLEVTTLQYNIKMAKALEPAMVSWDRLKINLLHGMETLMPVFNGIAEVLSAFFDQISDAIYYLTKFANTLEWAADVASGQLGKAADVQKRQDQLDKEHDNPADMGGAIAGAGIEATHRAGGGMLFKARGSDVVPAMLSPGEFIVDAKTTSKFLPQLQQMKYMASGGGVDTSQIGHGIHVTRIPVSSTEISRGGASGLALPRMQWGPERDPHRFDDPAGWQGSKIPSYGGAFTGEMKEAAAIRAREKQDAAAKLWSSQIVSQSSSAKGFQTEDGKQFESWLSKYGIGPGPGQQGGGTAGAAALQGPAAQARASAMQAPVPLQIPMPQITQRVNFDLAMTLQHEQAVTDAMNQIRSTLLNGISTTRDEVWLLGNMVNASYQVALDQM